MLRINSPFKFLLFSLTFSLAAYSVVSSPAVVGNDPSAMTFQSRAMQGFCPVTILDSGEWKKGSTSISSTYDNRTYYFVDEAAKKKFEANPPKYVPALGGDCIVCLIRVNKKIPGSVFHSVKHKGRLYLFPEDNTKNAFKSNPEKFENADLAFGGNCPVVRKGGSTEKGKPEFTVIVNDMRYQMASKEVMEEFKRNPKNYTR